MSTKINYLDELYSPITGCSGKNCPTKATCWAKGMVKRFPVIHEPELLEYPGLGISFERVQFHPDRLDKPLRWRKPRRVGVCFMGDLFDEQVPFEWVDHIFAVMGRAQWHRYFLLTKQPNRMREYIKAGRYDEVLNIAYRLKTRSLGAGISNPEYMSYWPWVYTGISITSQADAYRMIPELLRIPGKKWISLEPYLQGPIDIERYLPDPPERIPFRLDYLEWVVIGCESGPHRRPCKLEWMIDVVEQCKAAGVKCFVKQIDVQGKVCHDINQFPKELQVRERP